jgi:hypothetical protein
VSLPAGSRLARLSALPVGLLCCAGLVTGQLGPPPWTSEGYVEGSDAEPGWSFGQSVAIHRETAVVGADDALVRGVRSGAAYLFARRGNAWLEEAKLEVEGANEDDEIGWAVAVREGQAFVGTRAGDVGNQQAQGAVYVFSRSEGGLWELTQTLLASDGDEQDWFGVAIALDGDTLVVGAMMKDIAGQQQGAAYVFTLEDGEWVEQAKLFDPNGEVSDNFGGELALEGDRALIGAPAANVDGEVNRGAAYVFERVGSTWSLEQRLLASDGTFIDQFGSGVALHGDTALIGARHKPIDGMDRHGAAYFFERQGSSWVEVQRVLPSNGQAEGEFGESVALDGELALVGGEIDAVERGVVYEFRSDGGSWQETQQILPPAGSGFLDRFGRAMALDGQRAIFGHRGFGARGAAWIFRKPPLFADGFESGDTSSWSRTVP